MKLLFISIAFCFSSLVQAQHTFKAIIKSGEEKEPLAGATITWKEEKKIFVTDADGLIAITNIRVGKQTFLISHVGFEEKTVSFDFPLPNEDVLEIMLDEGDDHE
ncbi:MAG: carboxypeptidase-like regulatory domain-containing protein, partial [Flavisolibacter sp.]|nr:carboxypeptidase-like regulatory domain-containing protein [Flavisolibacter sp.]